MLSMRMFLKVCNTESLDSTDNDSDNGLVIVASCYFTQNKLDTNKKKLYAEFLSFAAIEKTVKVNTNEKKPYIIVQIVM